MPKIKITPLNIELTSHVNFNLMELLVSNGINLKNNCGAGGSCKKCTVKLLNGKLNKDAHYTENIYLACKSKILEDIEVELIDYSLNETFKLNKIFAFSSDLINSQIQKQIITHNPPTKEDKTCDLDRLMQNFPDYSISSIEIIKKLPFILRENSWHVSVITDTLNKSIIEIKKPDNKTLIGIAIDIGTTTVNILIVDLNNGKVIDSCSAYNEQISFGSDVISRIIYSQTEAGMEKLKTSVVSTINKLIDKLCLDNKIPSSEVYQAVIAGNTTMVHLLLGVAPNFIRIEPYVPVFYTYTPKVNDIGININQNASVYIYESVGSYVGGDITSGVLSSRLYTGEEISLLIDIGTNGEIVIGNSDWLISCACSAGPALEGAGVKHGTRAIDGAIDSVKIDAKTFTPKITTINSKKPIGICGSGIIDLIAQLYKTKIIDRQGKFIEQHSRIKNKSYILVYKGEFDSEQEIIINENDIQNIIRTKGAIYAGICSLLDYAGISLDDLSKIYVAGGLGENLSLKNCVYIGLFPDVEQTKYKYIGNSSLKGCYLRLINFKEENDIQKISQIMNYFDISEDNEYMNRFISSLFIPHTDQSLFPNSYLS